MYPNNGTLLSNNRTLLSNKKEPTIGKQPQPPQPQKHSGRGKTVGRETRSAAVGGRGTAKGHQETVRSD